MTAGQLAGSQWGQPFRTGRLGRDEMMKVYSAVNSSLQVSTAVTCGQYGVVISLTPARYIFSPKVQNPACPTM